MGPRARPRPEASGDTGTTAQDKGGQALDTHGGLSPRWGIGTGGLAQSGSQRCPGESLWNLLPGDQRHLFSSP